MPDKAWKLWVHHCAARRPPRNVVRATNLLLRAATHPSESLLFGSKGLFASDRSRRKSKQATETVLAALSAWSVEAAHTHRSRDAALDLLFAAYRVPFAARKLPQHDWWELLGLLRSQCEPGELAVPLHESTQLLLGIELPLVLSALLPDIGECRHLGGPAHAALAGLLEEMATQATWLSPASLEEIPGMLSSLARCLWIAEGTEHASTDTMRDHLSQIVGRVTRLLRPDGTLPFTQGVPQLALQPILASLARCGIQPKLAKAFATAGRSRRLSGKLRRRLPSPVLHEAELGLAVLRTAWSRQAPRVVVDFSTPDVRVEFATGKKTWAAGTWEYELSVAGQTLPRVAEWRSNCWTSDKHGDFLELQGDLDAATRLERQFYLSKSDGFLLVADCLSTSHPGPIRYAGRLPLAAEAQTHFADDACEVQLLLDRPLAQVLPLALPEWKADRRRGALTALGQALELAVASPGTGLYAPLLFDLHPERLTRAVTWRQLTVAESRQISPPGVAVGYRAQVGSEQWLVYKSIVAPAARTVLGQHLSCDFLIARFKRSGKLTRLVEIEPA